MNSIQEPPDRVPTDIMGAIVFAHLLWSDLVTSRQPVLFSGIVRRIEYCAQFCAKANCVSASLDELRAVAADTCAFDDALDLAKDLLRIGVDLCCIEQSIVQQCLNDGHFPRLVDLKIPRRHTLPLCDLSTVKKLFRRMRVELAKSANRRRCPLIFDNLDVESLVQRIQSSGAGQQFLEAVRPQARITDDQRVKYKTEFHELVNGIDLNNLQVKWRDLVVPCPKNYLLIIKTLAEARINGFERQTMPRLQEANCELEGVRFNDAIDAGIDNRLLALVERPVRNTRDGYRLASPVEILLSK